MLIPTVCAFLATTYSYSTSRNFHTACAMREFASTTPKGAGDACAAADHDVLAQLQTAEQVERRHALDASAPVRVHAIREHVAATGWWSDACCETCLPAVVSSQPARGGANENWSVRWRCFEL
jgi:hypothetical protein